MASTANGASNELSAAQKLAQTHAENHHVKVQDVPDEDLPLAGLDTAGESDEAATISAKAAGKQKETTPATLDTQSREAFPELGAPKSLATSGVVPKWNVLGDKANGTSPVSSTPRTSTPSSGVATPVRSTRTGAPAVSLPGRNVESIWLEPQHMIPRAQLRRPLPDIIRDINRRSRANVSIGPHTEQRMRFDATGPQDVAQQALKELVQQIGSKQTIRVPIPQSARAHIIGKQGSTIKALQEKTGAKIHLPKAEEVVNNTDEDEDADIDVVIEGNALSAAAARDEIKKIAGERAGNTHTKLKGIPAEFYPFLAGPNNSLVSQLEEANGAEIRIPTYHQWSSQVVPQPVANNQRPEFHPAIDHCIQLAGDRAAVQAAKAELERRAAELSQKLRQDQRPVQRGRHQFIIGNLGLSPEDFFEQTGCTILLPTDDDDDELVTVIGPDDAKIRDALAKAEDLAMSYQLANVDHLKWTNKQAPGRASAHSQNVTRYLRQRHEIERLEKQYNARINTPQDGALPWELYIHQGKNFGSASSDIRSLFDSLPPSRMCTMPVDPFFYQHLRNEVDPHVREDYGVHLVVPEPSAADIPILLVYEEPGSAGAAYDLPRAVPSNADIQTFQQGLHDAEKYIQELLNRQEEIVSVSIEVPQKYHDKLRRFIKKEQESREAGQIPVRVSNYRTTVTLKGPKSSVESLAEKVNAFIEQEKADEKERDFTLEFEFPQKFANHLIGKNGSKIKELREQFDVDIQVHDGKVELKGPKAKAAAAKAHIQSLGKHLADETTFTLKIEPKFHREIIGAHGHQINKLQTRYNVLIFFPRSEKIIKDEESNADAASVNGKTRRQQAPDEVIIRGPKKGAEEAREEVLDLYQFLKDHSFTATVSVQQKQLPSLIGQGGSGMEALRQQSGAKIDIPNGRDSPDSSVEIQIKGTKKEVAAAKEVLEKKKAIFDDTVVKTIDVEKKYHRALIGAGGANIRAMIAKAGGSDDPRQRARTIQFPKQESDGNTIKLEGRTEVVDKIIKQIQDIVAERESQVTVTVDIPVEKHRSLIGRGGDTKKHMESQFNVSIDIPRQGSGETSVRITGQSADAEKAKEHIINQTKEKPHETIQVPRNLHHAISNNGQFFRKLRNDHHVTVDHAGHSIPPKPTHISSRGANGDKLPLITEEMPVDAHTFEIVDNTTSEEGEIPWVLKGSPDNIEKAKKAIEAAITQAKTNVTGLLTMADPSTHRHVIGQGGSRVNSIRKQSGCWINVPRSQGEEEAIEIIGTKEGVEKAKDLILAAIRDGVNGAKTRD